MVCFRDMPAAETQQVYSSLVKLGLFTWATKEEAKEQEAQGYPCRYGVATTAKFTSTREFLIRAVADTIQQSRTLPETKPRTITKAGAAS